jgi:hypothetical protein
MRFNSATGNKNYDHGLVPISRALVVFGLMAFSAPALAEPAVPACEQIKAACLRAGFEFGGSRAGTGLWVDCIAPILEGRPPPNSTLPLPKLDSRFPAECKAADPNYAERHIVRRPGIKIMW